MGREGGEYQIAPTGFVEETGEKVKDFKIGDKVAVLPTGDGYFTHYINGGFAEKIIVPYGNAIKIPGNVSFDEAIVEPIGCLISGVERANISLGDSIAVIGCGFMGLALIQLLRLRGPGKIIAIDIRREALNNALRFGATEAYDLDNIFKEKLIEKWDGVGRGFDLVFETAGKQGSIDLGTRITGVHGKFLLVGFHNDAVRSIDVAKWNTKAITVISAHEKRNAHLIKYMKVALNIIKTGQLDMKSLITHQLTLEQVDRAFLLMEEKPADFIKAVIKL